MFGEQDNKTPGQIKQALEFSCAETKTAMGQMPATEVTLFGALQSINSLCDLVAELIPNSSTTDDILGAIGVIMRNNMGELVVTWVPISDINVRQGERGSATFRDMRDPYVVATSVTGLQKAAFELTAANGAKYHLVPAAEIKRRPWPQAWHYLAREYDECSRNLVSVDAADGGRIAVGRGQAAAVKLASRDIDWYCGDTDEHAACPNGTNLVVVQRYTRGHLATEISWKPRCIRLVMLQCKGLLTRNGLAKRIWTVS